MIEVGRLKCFSFSTFSVEQRWPLKFDVRHAKVAPFLWVRIHPANFAPAGSNRSSHGGNEVAEAFGVEGH